MPILCPEISTLKMTTIAFYSFLLQHILTRLSRPSNPHLDTENKTSTCDLDNEGTVKVNGEYEMPVSLMDINRFEI